jgi:hypothetical protein
MSRQVGKRAMGENPTHAEDIALLAAEIFTIRAATAGHSCGVEYLAANARRLVELLVFEPARMVGTHKAEPAAKEMKEKMLEMIRQQLGGKSKSRPIGFTTPSHRRR